ncbi:hypothetical protein [Streptomyces sp. NPDC001348]
MRSNGPALLLGWAPGLAQMGPIVLLVSGGAGPSDRTQPAGWGSALDLALGVLPLWVGVQEWGGLPRSDEGADVAEVVERVSPGPGTCAQWPAGALGEAAARPDGAGSTLSPSTPSSPGAVAA